jgi:Lanthionine-containing peptide SapB precursor RamS
MSILDLQALEPSGRYDDCYDDHDDECEESSISLLLC